MTRIAVLADIHGNLRALEAVVEDLEGRNPDLVVNLGDHASGPLWPRETVEFLSRQSWVHISGNCDREIVRSEPERQGPSDRYACEQMGPSERDWLARLPATKEIMDEILLVHGTPSDDAAYLLETVDRGRTRLASSGEIAQRLGAAAAGVVLCGHSHLPRVVRTNGALVVNPGSVGLQAYDQDSPEPHVNENGSPDARYALLERSRRGWVAELLSVPYDHRAAADQAERNGRPDWVIALRTGYMRG